MGRYAQVVDRYRKIICAHECRTNHFNLGFLELCSLNCHPTGKTYLSGQTNQESRTRPLSQPR